MPAPNTVAARKEVFLCGRLPECLRIQNRASKAWVLSRFVHPGGVRELSIWALGYSVRSEHESCRDGTVVCAFGEFWRAGTLELAVVVLV